MQLCEAIHDHQSTLLVVTLLQIALLQSASAAHKTPDECGLASVYSSVSEETASGEDTMAEDFTAAHRTLPFGTLVLVVAQKPVAQRSYGSPIAGLSSLKE